MGRGLASTVWVTHPDTGAAVRFVPGDTLPGWAEKAIPNAKAWTDDDGAVTGVVENADGETEEAVPGDPVPADDDAHADYRGMKVADLRALIADRNEGRDEADLIPDDGTKADLVAALEADDESD